MQQILGDFGCFFPCHKCIDNQINTFAGIELRLECNEIMKTKNYNLETGKAIITKGYNLPSKNVIHTVGPIIYDLVTEEKVEQIKKLIKDTDYILIGAGAGLSTAAGIEYTGKRFTGNFSEFIEKYHFTDMYSSGFYDFETEEEKWAYWAKHIDMNCVGMGATKLYKDLFEIVKGKNYFVITTNVDEQFYKSGFDKEKIFATQGSYRYIQCSQACHNKIYDATEIVKEMIEKTKDCKIPTELVPVCPVCGERMNTNLRKDAYFVQDDNWYKQSQKYDKFIENARDKKVVLLELGVGFNTPIIIRFPFEEMVHQNNNWNLVRINKDNGNTFLDIEDKSIIIEDDIKKVIDEISQL